MERKRVAIDMFRPESDKTIVRARIAHVRETLNDHGYLSMNPFLEGRSQQNLCHAFRMFADDTQDAARILSSQTDVPMFNVREADAKGYMYARRFYLAGKFGKNSEAMLCGVFQDRVYKTFRVLRKLEELELAGNGYDDVVAKDAMRALASTYVMAKAVPIALGNDKSASLPMLAAASRILKWTRLQTALISNWFLRIKFWSPNPRGRLSFRAKRGISVCARAICR